MSSTTRFARLEGDEPGELAIAMVMRVEPDRNASAPAYQLELVLEAAGERTMVRAPVTGRYEVDELVGRRILVLVYRKKSQRIARMEPVYVLSEAGLSLVADS
jgi:hypothetical protein